MCAQGLPPREGAKRAALRGASFQAPPGWRDDTVLSFRAPGEQPQPTVSVSRVHRAEGTPLEMVLTERVAILSRLLSRLVVSETTETRTAVGRAIGVRFTFAEDKETFVQRMSFVEGAGSLYVLVGRSLTSQAMQMDAVFDHLTSTFRPAALRSP